MRLPAGLPLCFVGVREDGGSSSTDVYVSDFKLESADRCWYRVVDLATSETDIAASSWCYRRLYLFNPVIIFNSAYWGQADSFHAFVVLGVWVLCCRRRFTLSALVLGFACAVKPHSVLAVPLVIVIGVPSTTRNRAIARVLR
ncbi:MAG: hypothetical protein R3E58_13570 [Phycisphaerae bacterium]